MLEGDTIKLPYTIMGECKGQALMERVEISPDGGNNWFPCSLNSKTNEWSFTMSSPLIAGDSYQILTRATDKSARTERTLNPNLDVRYRKRPLNVFIITPGTGRE